LFTILARCRHSSTHGGQFTALKISFADRRGGEFIDNEHFSNVIARIVARQITIKREELHRQVFRRDTGGMGSSGSGWY
jgi:hypothetical protein